MTGYVTVQEIFDAAGLLPCGPVSWGTPIPERSGGVYLIELVQPKEDGRAKHYLCRSHQTAIEEKNARVLQSSLWREATASCRTSNPQVRPFALGILGSHKRLRRCRRQNDRAISEVGRETALWQSNALGTRVKRSPVGVGFGRRPLIMTRVMLPSHSSRVPPMIPENLRLLHNNEEVLHHPLPSVSGEASPYVPAALIFKMAHPAMTAPATAIKIKMWM